MDVWVDVLQESVVEVVSPTLGANAGLLMMASAPAQVCVGDSPVPRSFVPSDQCEV
jgi:hypothetical protein